MLGAMTSLTGGGGMSTSSSASSGTGDFQGGNTGFHGGVINFAPSAGSTQGVSPWLIAAAAAVAAYAIFKK